MMITTRRLQVLKALDEAAQPVRRTALIETTGISPQVVYVNLCRLVQHEWVLAERARKVKGAPLLYSLTPQGRINLHIILQAHA